MSADIRCRGCGGALPAGALGGLCPVCLLRQGLNGDNSEAAGTGAFASLTHGPISASVLASLTEAFGSGSVPQTLLHDSDPGPLVLPNSPEMPATSDRTGRLQLLGEIARGGMGAVLKGRDPDLGRDLAVKVLLETHRDKPELIRRFIEEAQIGGQLQHPGIVPIYELGAFADRRPYFAMKLVKGRTLSSLIDERSDPARDLSRFLSIFEAVCQTMAYAHARGVIHRDLKPSNIMVGSFGEVQVMDWGLAKVLPQGGAADDASAGKTKDRDTVIATVRSGSDTDIDRSRAGSVLGTPSYMAPEQARGETDLLDERCDVFALGSILCELLTGDPAFTGRSSGEIQRKASRGELKECIDRLDRCEADPDLITLAKDCLAPELEDRPRHAGTVAERITVHRTCVEERLRLADIAYAEEKARAEEATKRARVERDRLRLTVALAASILGLILLGGGGWAYLAQLRAGQRAKTEQVVTTAFDEASVLRGQAMMAPVGDLSMWPRALAAAEKARSLLAISETGAALRGRVVELVATLEREQADAAFRASEADRDRRFIERLERIRLARFEQGDNWERSQAAAEYAIAFREFGIDIDRLDPVEAGRRLKERSNPLEVAFFLDDWALVRRENLSKNDPKNEDVQSWQRPLAVARATDPEPWRDAMRRQVGETDLNRVKGLASDEKALAAQPVRSLLLLAQVLESADEYEQASKVLKRAWRLRPDDFWICSQLATGPNYPLSSRPINRERVRFASAAVTLLPGNAWAHVALAEALLASNDPTPLTMFGANSNSNAFSTTIGGATYHEESERLPFWHEAFSRDLRTIAFFRVPDHFYVCSTAPYSLTINDEVVHELTRAIELSPGEAAIHLRLARVLSHQQGKVDLAISEFRQAARLNPEDGNVHLEFATYLFVNGRMNEAIPEIREAMRIEPKDEDLQFFLGAALQQKGDLGAASEVFRQIYLLSKAREGDPNFETNVAGFMHATATPEELIAVYRERMRSHPQDTFAMSNLGDILQSQERYDEASAVYREAIRLNPNDSKLHGLLAGTLKRQGKANEANAEFAKQIGIHHDAIKRQPKDAAAHQSLARALFDQGMRDEALKELRETFRVAPFSNPYSTSAEGFYLDGKVNQAIALCREAVRLKPADADTHNALGGYLLDFGEFDTAVAEIREARRIEPKNPNYLDSLGSAHFATGELKEALGNLREASHLMNGYPGPFMGADLRRVERLSALEPRLEAILRGQDMPADPDGKLDVANLCRVTRRFGDAARFYREAFQAEPALVNDHRLRAAIAAARAGTKPNPVKEYPPLDDTTRSRSRAQALEWLRAERSSCAKLLTQGLPAQRAFARKTLDILTHHRDLACVRQVDTLARLPQGERKDWHAFWAEVAALLKKADQH